MRGVVRGAIGATLCLLMHTGIVAAQGAITLLAGNQDPAEIGAAVEAFEREHPDIDVTLVLEAWDTVDDKFVTMVAAGEAPDVFINNSVYGWAKYAYQGLFQDLTPLVRRDAASLRWNEFFEPAIEQSKIGGTLYGMPAGPATGFATTYNATLFREAGLQAPPTDWSDPAWDWDAMVTAAKKLTEVGPDGRATQYGVDFWDADGPLLAMAYASGGDWFDPASYRDGVVHEVTLASPQNARAYQAVADLRIKDAVRPGGPLGGVGGGINNFGAGRIAMWLEIVQYNPRTFTPAAQFEWGFAPFPFPEGSARDRIASWGGGGFAAIPKGARNVEGAWTFLKWVASSDRGERPALANWMAVGGPRATWFAAMEQWFDYGISALSRSAMLEVLQGAVLRAVALPRQTVAGGTEVWQALQEEIGPALRGEVTVQEALARAQPRAAAAVEAFRAQVGLE